MSRQKEYIKHLLFPLRSPQSDNCAEGMTRARIIGYPSRIGNGDHTNFSSLKSPINLSFIKHANKTPMAENTTPRKKHDTLLKAAFEELFPYLLRFLLCRCR